MPCGCLRWTFHSDEIQLKRQFSGAGIISPHRGHDVALRLDSVVIGCTQDTHSKRPLPSPSSLLQGTSKTVHTQN
eukprot:2778982-Amphidinium_carterae.1